MACCWRHQVITCPNIDLASVRFGDIHLTAISEEKPRPSITKVSLKITYHDNVIKQKLFHRSPHKGQWRGALMFSLICAWINCWANNCEAGDLTRHRAHYDVTVMSKLSFKSPKGQWVDLTHFKTLIKKQQKKPAKTATISQMTFWNPFSWNIVGFFYNKSSLVRIMAWHRIHHLNQWWPSSLTQYRPRRVD